jgi:hypothetical protein
MRQRMGNFRPLGARPYVAKQKIGRSAEGRERVFYAGGRVRLRIQSPATDAGANRSKAAV